MGFFRRAAVRISLKQLGERSALPHRKKTTRSQSRMCPAMFAGQSLPAGMPSSYQRRTPPSCRMRMVSTTCSEDTWA